MTPASFRQHRRRLSLTQIELAALLGVGNKTVCRWEKGTHPMPAMLALALAAILHGIPPVQ